MIDLHSSTLLYLTKTAELGSIRQAAISLNVASSAINRKILNLEARLGYPLFKRTPKGVVPTAAGALILRHAQNTLFEYHNMIDEIRCLNDTVSGQVRIVALASVVESLFPRFLDDMMTRYPEIDFRVVVSGPAEIFDQLRSGDFDVGITFSDNREERFDIHAVLDLTVGAVMRADHPLAGNQAVTLSDCARYPTVHFADPWAVKNMSELEFKMTGADFRSKVATNSISLMKEVILSGFGIGFLTSLSFRDEIGDGRIRLVPITPREFVHSSIALLTSRNRVRSTATGLILEELSLMFARIRDDIRKDPRLSGRSADGAAPARNADRPPNRRRVP